MYQLKIVLQKPPADNVGETETPTIESISSKRRKLSHSSPAEQDGQRASTDPKSILKESEESEDSPEGIQDLEEEADGQGAFNPETGEINWDCPCLGGMAHGPCGEEFKAAFSCFVYSKEEPKGMDCIENFKGMQDCFRKYPEIYGEELDEDEEVSGDHESGDDDGVEDTNPSPLPSTVPSDSPARIGTPEKVAETRPPPSTSDSKKGVAVKADRQDTRPVESENDGALISKASRDAKADGGDKQ